MPSLRVGRLSMRSTAVLVILIMHTTVSQAQPVMTYGAGAAASRGKWLDQRRTGQYIGMINWALGFISGAAIYGSVGNPLGETDADGGAYWLDNYCRRDPSAYFNAAAKAFIGAHER
jgi:hypothetical protein